MGMDDILTEKTGLIGLPGAQVRVRWAGSGGPALILLHGWGGSSRYWRHLLAEFAPSRLVIAPDLPGYGDSPPMQDAATPKRLAQVVLDLADRLGLAQFDLNGHSFSAGVAAHVAASAPDRVRRLVLTSFSTFRDERERQVVEQVHRLMEVWMNLRRPWMAERRWMYRVIGRRFFYRLPTDDQVLRDCVTDFLKMDRRVALESARSAGDKVITATLEAVRAPTLLVAARQDGIMPPVGAPVVARQVPNCTLHWLEGCGHLPMLEQPAEYEQVVKAFLSQ